MTSSNQDWYVCLHIMDICPKVTTLGCVNISRIVHDHARPQLERHRLHPSEADDVSDTERYADHEILFKNPLTNNTIHRLVYDSYCEVFATIDTKVYVKMTNRDSTSFQVYDPSHDSWKTLPPLPNSDSCCNYVCRHMICVRGSKSHVFDTIEEKWFVSKVALQDLECTVEFSGFLIGVLHDKGYRNPMSIAAYKLDDDNGLPDANSRHILDDDLRELFYPPLTPRHNSSILHRFGDDKVVLVSCVENGNMNGKFLVIAVFRVSVSNVSGIPVIRAAFEHKQVYSLAKDHVDPNEVYLNVRSTFLMQNAPNHCSRVSNMLLDEGSDEISLRRRKRQRKTRDRSSDSSSLERSLRRRSLTQERMRHVRRTSSDYDNDDDVVVATEAKIVVEWVEHLKEKSLYMCFVENRTDSSVAYIIKAIKFSDLISLNPKLHKVASTCGSHLPYLPSCGVFGSQILFAGGGNEDYLRELEPTEEDPAYSDCEYYKEVEVPQQAPINRSIYSYDVKSTDQIIEKFPSSFKGMKPQPILAEVGGKLYALAKSPMPHYLKNSCPYFEVFDPIEKQWSPLSDPPTYTMFPSSRNYHVVAGSNILSWGGNDRYGATSRFSPGVFRFDMAADKDWRLVNSSGQLVDDDNDWRLWSLKNEGCGSSIAVDIGGGSFVLFRFGSEHRRHGIVLQVHLISCEFESVVTLPMLKMPKSVTTLLKAQNAFAFSTFVHLGGSRVCLLVSSKFSGPYSRTLRQFGEVDKMSIVILVFEFQVSEDRKSVAAELVFHQVLDCFDINTTDATHAERNPKTSDAHMVGAFLV